MGRSEIGETNWLRAVVFREGDWRGGEIWKVVSRYNGQDIIVKRVWGDREESMMTYSALTLAITCWW